MSRATTSAGGMGSVARGGAFALAGSVVSAVMGLLLVVVLGRTLGTAGAGVVFQAIAAFTIAMSLARFGLDTTAVWLLPRLRTEAPHLMRAAVVRLLAPAFAMGVLGAGALLLLSRLVGADNDLLADSLVGMAWALPLAGVALVGLAATRALGGVRTFVTVQNIAIPTARPVLAWAVTLAGGGAVAVAVSWVAPLPLAAGVALLILARQLRRVLGDTEDLGSPEPGASLNRRIWGYTAPRAVSAVLEESMRWLDVLLVGLLAGPSAAGLYGAATRFTNAGMILSTSLRIVVAPMYSRHLGAKDLRAADGLYSVTTIWIIAFSVPIYLVLALFGGSMIGLLGQDFREGAPALGILAGGMAMVLTAGNIQSVLLMSGHSSLAALNKLAAVAVNVTLLFLLVPPLGIVGAALAWVAGMVIDTVLAITQVHRKVGVRPLPRAVLAVLATTVLTFGTPALILRLSIGDTVTAMLSGAALGVVCLVIVMWRAPRLFQLADLASIITARKGT